MRKEKQNNYSDFFEDKKIGCKMGKINDKDMGEIKYYYEFDILSIRVYDLIVEAKKNPYLIYLKSLI